MDSGYTKYTNIQQEGKGEKKTRAGNFESKCYYEPPARRLNRINTIAFPTKNRVTEGAPISRELGFLVNRPL